MTTTDEATISLIDALFHAPCPKCKGDKYIWTELPDEVHSPVKVDCTPCSGTGKHPLADLLRVELRCSSARWPHPDDCYCMDQGKYRPATPDEAKALFHDLLEATKFSIGSVSGFDAKPIGKWWTGSIVIHVRGDTPLLALLKAMASVMKVEVTV